MARSVKPLNLVWAALGAYGFVQSVRSGSVAGALLAAVLFVDTAGDVYPRPEEEV